LRKGGHFGKPVYLIRRCKKNHFGRAGEHEGGPAPGQMKVRRNRIPLAARLAVSVFVLVLISDLFGARTVRPISCGFCDAALLLTAAGMWRESSLVISMCAVGILLSRNAFGSWDFWGQPCWAFICWASPVTCSTASCRCSRRGPLAVSTGWLPILLAWLLTRVGLRQAGLDRLGGGLATSLVLVCYFFYATGPAPGGRTPTCRSTSIMFTGSTTGIRKNVD